jgi:hypothetical protein
LRNVKRVVERQFAHFRNHNDSATTVLSDWFEPEKS